MRYEIRELDVGGILDQAIKLTKDHFWLFLKIVAVLMIPISVITGLLVLWNMPDTPAMAQPGMFVPGARVEYSATLTTIFAVSGLLNLILVFPLTDAAMIYAIANCYLEKPSSMGIAFNRAFRIFLPLIGTWILMYVIVLIGFILLIIPGFIFLFWYTLATRVVVVEGVSGMAALKRSKQLMKGNVGTVFVLGIILFVIGAASGWVPRLIPQAELRVIITSIFQAVLSIFAAATMVVFYFSCRCKAENFDLTMLADAVATGEPPPLPSGTMN
jgi:hypothetical protein